MDNMVEGIKTVAGTGSTELAQKQFVSNKDRLIDSPVALSHFESSDTEDQLWNKLAGTLLRDYGITSMLYAFTHSKYTVSRTGIMPSIYFRHNFPEDYLATYPNGLTLDDSVAASLLLEGRTHLLWSDFETLELSECQRRRVGTDKYCGMGVGLSLGFRFGANNGVAGLCMAAQQADAKQFNDSMLPRMAEIRSHCSTFDTLMRPAMIANRIMLTPREKDVLSYSAGGMTVKEIGKYLHISPKTVANTLERARKSLGAVSTMEAVAKALVYELIC